MLNLGDTVYLKTDPERAEGQVVRVYERQLPDVRRGLVKAVVVAWKTGRSWVYSPSDLSRAV